MFGPSAHVWVFSIAAFGVWLAAFVWSLKQGRLRWYYLFALLLATVFWAIGETLGIRLGKYDYTPEFGLFLPFGGPPVDQDQDLLLRLLLRFVVPANEAGIPGCAQRSWNVPIAVVALEAALLFSFLRVSFLRLKNSGWRAALATAGLSGFLMLNATAILDPVVSTTTWCPDPSASTYHGLNFGLWHWYTNDIHPGYWFGVPLVNYIAWFLSVGTFSFMLRLDDHGPRGLVRRYKHWYGYLSALIVLLLIFGLLIPLKVLVDRLFVHGQDYLFTPHHVFYATVWQFGVLLGLLVAALWLLNHFGKLRPDSQVEWVSSLPQLAVFVFCLGALVVQPSWRIFLVWLVTAVIALTVIFWPFVARIIARLKRHRPSAQDEVAVDV
jgi:hypothetical protein